MNVLRAESVIRRAAAGPLADVDPDPEELELFHLNLLILSGNGKKPGNPPVAAVSVAVSGCACVLSRAHHTVCVACINLFPEVWCCHIP